MKQKEIIEEVSLLNENGVLNTPGYSRHNHFKFNLSQLKKQKWRYKQWNYYQISDGNYMIQLNIFNIGVATSLSATYLNLKTGRIYSDGVIELFTPHKNQLDTNGEQPSHISYSRYGRHGVFDVSKNSRRLTYKGSFLGRPFEMDFLLKHLSNHESLVTATPFEKEGQFFLTQKMNCMPASGYVRLGNKKHSFDSKDTYAVMDWGRGVWPHSNMWYWANGSTRINGKLFGFELTWGFGDTSNATATALFYDGVCHKLGNVYLEKDPEENNSWMEPWHFLSEDGRLDLTMTPFYDHINGMIPFGLVGLKGHQVHGKWNGTVTLDDGTVLMVHDMYAFCEKVYNKW